MRRWFWEQTYYIVCKLHRMRHHFIKSRNMCHTGVNRERRWLKNCFVRSLSKNPLKALCLNQFNNPLCLIVIELNAKPFSQHTSSAFCTRQTLRVSHFLLSLDSLHSWHHETQVFMNNDVLKCDPLQSDQLHAAPCWHYVSEYPDDKSRKKWWKKNSPSVLPSMLSCAGEIMKMRKIDTFIQEVGIAVKS